MYNCMYLSLSLSIYIYTYIYICICVYIYIYIHITSYVYVFVLCYAMIRYDVIGYHAAIVSPPAQADAKAKKGDSKEEKKEGEARKTNSINY